MALLSTEKIQLYVRTDMPLGYSNRAMLKKHIYILSALRCVCCSSKTMKKSYCRLCLFDGNFPSARWNVCGKIGFQTEIKIGTVINQSIISGSWEVNFDCWKFWLCEWIKNLELHHNPPRINHNFPRISQEKTRSNKKPGLIKNSN